MTVLVAVAMSGGVDSSVAAALLVGAGHDVIGVTMQIWPDEGQDVRERHGGCCAMGAVRDARAVATTLGIPYYVFGMREAFERQVIAGFAAAYAAGRTPNPCIACNAHIKFEALLDKARRLGADALATGHYAQLRPGADGGWRLCRAADARKDQSYVLYPLQPRDMGFVRFPLGAMTKAETRQTAAALGLAVADKPDSQEICFVTDEGYAAVVAERHPEAVRPGPILDLDGRVIGRHRGIAHYTVGQRRGLDLPGSEARFVIEIDAVANALIVGPANATGASGAIVPAVHWLVPEPPPAPSSVRVKVRSGPAEHDAVIAEHRDGGIRLDFLAPVRAVTPGQACVLYQGDVVLGGGEIAAALRPGLEGAWPTPALTARA